MAEVNDVMQEIQGEIDDKKKELEIEVVENQPPKQEVKVEEQQPEQKPEEKPKQEKAEDDSEYGRKVQRRIKNVLADKKKAEEEAKLYKSQLDDLQNRLNRLEEGSVKQAETNFQERYNQTKAALAKAIEEGDTEAQLNFTEQMADMRSAFRIQQLQEKQRQAQAASPTVGKAEQEISNPAPPLAMKWWEENTWFNAKGFERESAVARSIDVQLDAEGYDKNSPDYYKTLNNRLRKLYPELISGKDDEVGQTKPRVKSRDPVAPTAGGSAYKGNRVKVTRDELAIARELGITDEKALKKYANEIQKTKTRS
jgi:hypothetical protein